MKATTEKRDSSYLEKFYADKEDEIRRLNIKIQLTEDPYKKTELTNKRNNIQKIVEHRKSLEKHGSDLSKKAVISKYDKRIIDNHVNAIVSRLFGSDTTSRTTRVL